MGKTLGKKRPRYTRNSDDEWQLRDNSDCSDSESESESSLSTFSQVKEKKKRLYNEIEKLDDTVRQNEMKEWFCEWVNQKKKISMLLVATILLSSCV